VTDEHVSGPPVPPGGHVNERTASVVDGAWHRMHPATPLLKGGIALIAVLGFIIANLRERIIDFFVHAPSYGGDPIDAIYRRGLTGWALLAVLVVILLAIGLFTLSWRMQAFRVSDEAVELRSGIFSRSHRKARLDRIQGINVHRPLFARIFGAAKLEILVAGHDANLHLAYLHSDLAEDLRREILRLASGARRQADASGAAGDPARPGPVASAPDGQVQGSAVGGEAGLAASAAPARRDVIGERVGEFLMPADLDPDAAPPESIVKMHPGRLAGSLLLSGFTVFLLAVVAAIVVGASTGHLWVLFALLPGALGAGGFYTRRFSKALRYTISGTDDGVRVGFGLLATSSETIPPGRIHAVEVLQPIMWRPFGWWQIRINTAGHSRQKGAAGEANTTTLPVGDARDVQRVIPLLLPGMDDQLRAAVTHAGMMGGDGALFGRPPRSARWLRPFSWRRTGYTVVDGVVVLRLGAIWRRTVFVPLARMQSVELQQGPARRMLGLAAARVHTVDGPVRPRLSVIGVAHALDMFRIVSAGAIEWAGRDRSHRWKANDANGAAS
jgi:putative membrane protein